ncbi:MAG TPA: diacylglycerol kinase family protein [Longimicrobiaceae bacterium]|nr:diacylglycerol kinase family protein [Longimicrobiaceae bacterium]
MPRSLLVYNPAAGQWWRRPRPERLLRALERRGWRAELLTTRGQDHATQLVRQGLAPEVEAVWVCGGDGTVAQAATALVDTDVPLGILPSGTVNVIALECGIRGGPLAAVEALARARASRRFRTWSVSGRAVLLGVGVGFEARAIGNVGTALKDWLGLLAVGGQGVAEWARYEFPLLRATGVDHHGNRFDLGATQVLVTNPPHYAGHHTVAPGADPADALLDVVLFRGASRLAMAGFWMGIELPGALHLRVPGTATLRARRLRVESADGRAVEAHVNGDAVEATPVSIEPWGTVRLLAAEG